MLIYCKEKKTQEKLSKKYKFLIEILFNFNYKINYYFSIKMSKNVQKSLKGMPSITKDLTFEESAKLFQSGRKCWDLLKHKEKKNMITMKKLISIIRIATMINNDDIYLSDIIRLTPILLSYFSKLIFYHNINNFLFQVKIL